MGDPETTSTTKSQLSLGILELPEELLQLIIFKLDDIIVFGILPFVCRKFNGLYIGNFHRLFPLICPPSNDQYQTQVPRSLFLETLRTMKRILVPYRTSELSDRIGQHVPDIEPCSPRNVFIWPDGTPIPSHLSVIVFTTTIDGSWNYSTIHTMIIRRLNYINNPSYAEGLGSIALQKFTGLRQIVFFKIEFDMESVQFIKGLKLQRIYLNDCKFKGAKTISLSGQESPSSENSYSPPLRNRNRLSNKDIADLLNAEHVYIESNEELHMIPLTFGPTLKKLTVYCRASDSAKSIGPRPHLYFFLTESTQLEHL